jgi:hypothetical protein
LGAQKVPAKVEQAIREHLSARSGSLKVVKIVGVGSGTVARVERGPPQNWGSSGERS